MKVLWFANTPSNAASIVGTNYKGAGWVSSLEDLVNQSPEIELGLCFFREGEQDQNFCIGNTKYYAVGLSKSSILPRVFKRITRELPTDKKINTLLNVVKDFEPDIIHVFGSEEVFGILAMHVNIPVVIHIQGLLNPLLENWFPRGVSNSRILYHTPLTETLRAAGLFFSYRILKKMAEREAIILSGSKYFMGRTVWDYAVSRAFSPNSKYFHCDEVIRPDFWTQKWAYAEGEKFVISTTINSHIYKGIDTILKTAKLLSLNSNFKFVWKVFGIQKNNEIVKLFEKLMNDRFDNYNVEFMGPVNADILKIELLQTSLFVHPSHIDNSPNSVCEAMVMGIPVISSNVGGVSSIIQNGFDGILYPDNDQYLLSHHILKLAVDSSRLIDLGNNAYNSARKRHDKDKILSDLLNIYSEIISDNKNSAT